VSDFLDKFLAGLFCGFSQLLDHGVVNFVVLEVKSLCCLFFGLDGASYCCFRLKVAGVWLIFFHLADFQLEIFEETFDFCLLFWGLGVEQLLLERCHSL
jgi:hypothetical protein